MRRTKKPPVPGVAQMLEIRDRLDDLRDALKKAGRLDLVRELRPYPGTLISASRVRPGVEGLRQLCEHWRAHGGTLPDLPVVTLAANRLEDACRGVIAGGAYPVLPPTVGQRVRRISIVVTIGVTLFGLVVAVPLFMTASGVDITDLGRERLLPPVALPRGGELRVEVSVLAESLAPEATQGVAFAPKERCVRPSGGGSCVQTEPQLWDEGRLPTYELKLAEQAFGLFFALTGEKVVGKVGTATLLLRAAEDTPEGRYELPMTASYLGYTPIECGVPAKWFGGCPPPSVGEGARHVGLDVPVVVVDVIPPDAGFVGAGKAREEAAAAAARERAEARSKEIAAAIGAIGAAMGEVDELMRKSKWEAAKEKLEKLGVLFAPLEEDLLGGGGNEEVDLARQRYESLRDRMADFESGLFEDAFKTLKNPSNEAVPEDSLMNDVARRNRVSRAYLEEIYTARADEIQTRLVAEKEAEEERKRKEEQELLQRCGKAPQNTWGAVQRYATDLHPGEEIEMRECLSPRLDSLQCWVVVCRYITRGEVSDERPKAIMKYRGAFFIKNDFVTHHGPPPP